MRKSGAKSASDNRMAYYILLGGGTKRDRENSKKASASTEPSYFGSQIMTGEDFSITNVFLLI